MNGLSVALVAQAQQEAVAAVAAAAAAAVVAAGTQTSALHVLPPSAALPQSLEATIPSGTSSPSSPTSPSFRSVLIDNGCADNVADILVGKLKSVRTLPERTSAYLYVQQQVLLRCVPEGDAATAEQFVNAMADSL